MYIYIYIVNFRLFLCGKVLEFLLINLFTHKYWLFLRLVVTDLLQMWALLWVAVQTRRHPSSGNEAALSLHGPRRRGAFHPGRHHSCWCGCCGRYLVASRSLLHLHHVCRSIWLQPVSHSSSTPFQPAAGITGIPCSNPGPWDACLPPCTV